MGACIDRNRWIDRVPDPMIPLPYRVESVQRELQDSFTLELRAEDGGMRFEPGQFNMLYRFGVGEVPISISGDPADTGKLLHTVRAVGAVTRALEGLEPGETLGIRGPFGKPWPVKLAEGQDVVIVAGGIGLAPLRPVIHHLLTQRERYGSICLFYGARTPQDILYAGQLMQWRGRFDMKVDVTVDRADPSWRGKVGVVTKLLGERGFAPLDTLAMLCGPEIMMRHCIMGLNDLGVGNERIYVSMERNMKCAVGFCGHCQFGGAFVCKDGPVFRFDRIAERFGIREL